MPQQASVTAGIPVSSPLTTVGALLWEDLHSKRPAFVATVQRELQALAVEARPEDRLAIMRHRAVLEEFMYYIALADAYAPDAPFAAELRSVLIDSAGGTPPKLPRQISMLSKVQLLDGSEGSYMIGSVQFSEATAPKPRASQSDAAAASPSPSSDPHTPSSTPGPSSDPHTPSSSPGPSTSGVPGSWPPEEGGERGEDADLGEELKLLMRGLSSGERLQKLLAARKVGRPSRMSRRGAAQCYHTYIYWGYFQMRMALRRSRQKPEPQQPGSSHSFQLPRPQVERRRPLSSYGEAGTMWRHYELVPDEMTDLRTAEAVAAADRHLRALFGDEQECITTLAAWRHMCEEARQFGRALYDAEELVVGACGHHVTLISP